MYAVYWNMPGYMPDSDALECETLEEAKECLATEVTHYLEDLNLDERFTQEQVEDWSKELERFDRAPAQECNFWVGQYVYTITST